MRFRDNPALARGSATTGSRTGYGKNTLALPSRLKRARALRRSPFGAALLLFGKAVAPWCLGGAAVVSFTAAAGETSHVVDPGFRRTTMIEAHRMTLVPPRLSPLLMVSTARSAADGPDEVDPSDVRRLGAADPSSARVLPHLRRVDLARNGTGRLDPDPGLLFLDNTALLAPSRLEPAVTAERAGQALLAHLHRFEGKTLAPVSGGGSGGTQVASASPRDLARAHPEGTTPLAARAVRLASTTPAPIEPEVIAATALRVPSFAKVHAQGPARSLATAGLGTSRGYLDLIDPEAMKREQKCLAEAVYFEARSEPEAGQAAVAQVVLNRVRSGLYPASVCGVVYQNRHRYKACQFTFACEGKSLATTEPGPWATAQRIAKQVLEGATYLPAVGASTHYHADYVAPYWSRKLKRTDRIGRHIFYRLRPGQT